MGKLWKEDLISREVKRELYERLVIPTMVYAAESGVFKVTGEKKTKSI